MNLSSPRLTESVARDDLAKPLAAEGPALMLANCPPKNRLDRRLPRTHERSFARYFPQRPPFLARKGWGRVVPTHTRRKSK